MLVLVLALGAGGMIASEADDLENSARASGHGLRVEWAIAGAVGVDELCDVRDGEGGLVEEC
jgi:hypothetical protein